MHKLIRANAPDSLKELKKNYPKIDEWAKVTATERDEIRAALFSMQGYFCAYCERTVTTEHGHIEHFKRRSMFPQNTFDWNNLFYSCSNHDSCGKHKDEKIPAGNIDYNKMIDPCVDNPEDFLFFNSNGDISPRENLPQAVKARAEETIRVFGLQNLRKERANTFKSFEYLISNPDLIDQILTDLNSNQSFITMLYHVFNRRRVA
jgi:uncharacterized protein (TIGR02646 family)